MSEVDHGIARLAERQHGAVARPQLLALGLSRRGIEDRLQDGLLHPLYRGVYLVGRPVELPHAGEMGAVLACGPGTLITHRTSLELWELLPRTGQAVHVTVPGKRRTSRSGIVVHRSRPLDPRDYGRIEGIPVTNVGRSLLDFAEVASGRELERAYDEAATQRLINDLDEVLARHPGRHGAKALASLLDNVPALTQSEAEEQMLALIRKAGLPHPEVNVRVGRWQLDFFWRDQQLNIEVDGHRYHSLEKQIARNHVRDADLEVRRIRVRRVTVRELTRTPEVVVARIARAL